mgnify:CR=1 FL=1
MIAGSSIGRAGGAVNRVPVRASRVRVGGGRRFYQRFTDDVGVLWGVVTWFEPGKRLGYSGTLDMQGAVAGMITFDLEPQGDGALLKLRHYAVGVIAEETRTTYDAGWNELLGNRLAAYVERGIRYTPAE